MDEIILKYLRNEMDIEDQHLLTKWLNEDDLNKRILNKIELFWNSEPNPENVKEKVWAKLADQIELDHDHRKPKVNQVVLNLMKVAAILVVAFFLSFLVLESRQSGGDADVEQVRYLEKVSLYGQKINIQLPDGSKVKLNAGSKLIVPEKFTNDRREVELVGEAFFDIQRDESRPFIVKSGDVDVEVLGTAFNVRAYPEEEDIKVAVDRGRVAVRGKKNADRLVLLPDEMAIYDIKDNASRKSNFNRKAVFSWKDKILYFDQASFDEILIALKKWYGVEFILKGSYDLKKDFSGEYHNKSLQSVLDGLSYVYEFEYEIKDDIVTIN